MTHSDIRDARIRNVYANELLLVRRKVLKGKYRPTIGEVAWLLIGLETAFRRCDVLLKENHEH